MDRRSPNQAMADTMFAWQLPQESDEVVNRRSTLTKTSNNNDATTTQESDAVVMRLTTLNKEIDMFGTRTFIIRFFISFMFGFLTVTAAQLAFADDWDDWDDEWSSSYDDDYADPEPNVYQKMYPDIDTRDGYNYDTHQYEDVEIIHDYGHEVEIYNWDTNQYQWVDPQ